MSILPKVIIIRHQETMLIVEKNMPWNIQKECLSRKIDNPSPKLATDYPSIFHFIVHLPS